MSSHEDFMRRCFDLARLGKGAVAPNPLVGSVVVHDSRIIGEGYHRRYGESHAEVNAIASVDDEALLHQSTLYVNLEPCSHHGKMPPCADLIIQKKIPRVVICNIDPFEEVAGKGVQRLQDAGIEVTTRVLEKEGRWLNRRFFTFHEEQRPFIILKFAQTNDGYLDAHRSSMQDGPPTKITTPQSDMLVHKWRSREASILIGLNTVKLDNPSLTVRNWKGSNPLRLVIDPQLQMKEDRKLLNDGNPSWVFNAIRADQCENEICYIQINDPDNFLSEIVEYLYKQGIQSLIVEGGATTLSRFISSDLWDEARIFTGPMRIGSGVNSPDVKGNLKYSSQLGQDLLQVYTRV